MYFPLHSIRSFTHFFSIGHVIPIVLIYTAFRGKTITIDMCIEEKMNSLLDERSSCIAVEIHFIFSQLSM